MQDLEGAAELVRVSTGDWILLFKGTISQVFALLVTCKALV